MNALSPPAPSPLRLLARKLMFAGVALLFVWLVLGQILPRFFIDAPAPEAPTVSEPAPDEALIARITALEEKIAHTPPAAPDAALLARIEALETASKSAPHTLDASAFQALQQQVADLSRQFSENKAASSRASAVQALYRLREQVRGGERFTVTLAQLREAAPDKAVVAEPLAALEALAENTIPTLAALQKEFPPLARAALGATPEKTVSGTLSTLVSIRKTGEQQGTSDEATIARAETRLMAGNVSAAREELALSSPAATSVFAPWSARAEQHLKANAALLVLEAALLAP